MCQSCFVLESLMTSGSYNLSTSSSAEILEPRRHRFEEDTEFRTECCTVSCSLHVVQCWLVPVLTIIFCKKKLLWWELSDVLIYRYSNVSCGVFLLLGSLRRMIGYFNGVRYGFHITKWTLISIKQWWVTSVAFGLYCTSISFRQVAVVGWRICSWVICDYFSSPVACKVPFITINTSQ